MMACSTEPSPRCMPTNEQAPDYNVSVVGLSYIYRWQ